MGDLTPFQNQVLDAAQAKEQEKKEERREEMQQQQGGSTPNRNARSAGGGSGGSPGGSDMGQEETVRYVNKELNPDHEVHESE